MFIFECIVLGFLIATISVFTGLGGGVIMVPLFPLLFGYSALQSVATSLTVVFLNGLQLVFLSRKAKLVNTKMASQLGIVGVGISVLTSIWIYSIPSLWLKIFLIVILSMTGAILAFDIKLKKLARSKGLALTGVGAFAGFTSAISGLGGGIVVGPLIYSMGLSGGAGLAPTVSFVTTIFAGTAVATHLAKNLPNGTLGPIQIVPALLIFAAAFVFSRLMFRFQGSISDKGRRQMMLLMTVLLLVVTVVRL